MYLSVDIYMHFMFNEKFCFKARVKTIVLKGQIFMRKLDYHGLAADLKRLGLDLIINSASC